jgi:hypothetical protein
MAGRDIAQIPFNDNPQFRRSTSRLHGPAIQNKSAIDD